MSARILGVIPARAGSRAVPNKNIRPMLGVPLLAWTIDCARRSQLVTDICLSTDDEEYRQIGLDYGAEVPFLRPEELSHDRALAVPTIQHAAGEMEKHKGIEYDVVVMLQPTSPLKTPDDLDTALQRLLDTPEASAIISVVHVDNFHPMKMKKFLGDDGNTGQMIDYEKPPKENCPRQELPPVYIVNGVMYATRRDVLMKDGSFQGTHCLGHIMPADRSVNIDAEVDFMIAEQECEKQGREIPVKVNVS